MQYCVEAPEGGGTRCVARNLQKQAPAFTSSSGHWAHSAIRGDHARRSSAGPQLERPQLDRPPERAEQAASFQKQVPPTNASTTNGGKRVAALRSLRSSGTMLCVSVCRPRWLPACVPRIGGSETCPACNCKVQPT